MGLRSRVVAKGLGTLRVRPGSRFAGNTGLKGWGFKSHSRAARTQEFSVPVLKGGPGSASESARSRPRRAEAWALARSFPLVLCKNDPGSSGVVGLVRGRLLSAVNDQHFDGSFAGFQRQTELLP
jgi:hypothetical protein